MRASWPMMSIAGLVLVVSSCATSGDDGPGAAVARSARTRAHVVRVVDGDTIHVLLDGNDTTVRLIGIDTPEVDGPYTQEECFGTQASAYTTDALEGATVGLEFDVEREDRFGRTLAYVWLGGELFDERVLRDGYAVVLTVPPNVRHAVRLVEAQRAARDDGAGLWGACPGRP